MRQVLIDECINPRLAPRLRSALPGYGVETVRELGWAGQRDHLLVHQIDRRFDVFVTIDKGFEFEHNFEHNLEKLSFGIVIIEAANNQMSSYERLLNELNQSIQAAVAGEVIRVRDPERS